MVQKLFAKPFWCTFYNVLKRTKHRLRETQTDRQTEVSLQLVPRVKQGIAPGAARRYAPTADGSSTVAKIAADLRLSADGSAVRTSLVDGVPIV